MKWGLKVVRDRMQAWIKDSLYTNAVIGVKEWKGLGVYMKDVLFVSAFLSYLWFLEVSQYACGGRGRLDWKSCKASHVFYLSPSW